MGLFSTPNPADWHTLGRELGLAPFVATTAYVHGQSFRQMKRALGVPAGRVEPSFQHWLYGAWRGTEIVVLSFEVGSGSSATTYTGVAARVDPPLFLGFGLRPHGFLEGLFGANDVRIGEETADAKLHLTGFVPGQVAVLLSPHDAAGSVLVRTCLGLLHLDVRVSDSVVVLAEAGVHSSARVIAPMCDAAVALAGAFAARRRAIPSTAQEEARRLEWRRFADQAELAFDPERMKMQGGVAGSSIEMALETDGQQICTAVSVRFPQPIAASLTVRQTQMPSFLQRLLTQDIRIGDAELDDAFLITGHPVEAVRAALARPGVLAALKLLATRSEVQMNHGELYFRVAGDSASGGRLTALLDIGRTTSLALFGPLRGSTPYR
jgi:hypothetical protein